MLTAKLLAELTGTYAKFGLKCGDGLQPPSSEIDIRWLESKLGFSLPEELIVLLQIHGGQEYMDAGTVGLFGSHKLLSPSEIIDWYNMTLQVYQWHRANPPDEFPPKKGEGGWWNPRLVPFAVWDAYGLCIHADRGDVWNFEPYSGMISHLPSIEATMRWLIDEVTAGREPDLPFNKNSW